MTFECLDYLPAFPRLEDEQPDRACSFHPGRLVGRRLAWNSLRGRYEYQNDFHEFWCESCQIETPYE